MNSSPSTTAKFCRLDGFGILSITGDDRIEFLQGQMTQDMQRLEKQPLLAGWTTAKGRLLALPQLVADHEEIWLILPRGIIEGIARRLSMFVLRAKVQIQPSERAVAGLLARPAKDEPVDAGNLRVVPVTGDPDRFWMIGDVTGELPGSIVDPVVDPDFDAAWTLASIRSGVPSIIAATQELFVPQMLNLDRLDGISFEKGCYVGQEIVARTQNLGRIKRRMYRFSVADRSPLEPGSIIYGPGPATGKIVLSAPTSQGKECLAVVAIDAAAEAWFADESRSRPLVRESLPYSIDT